MIPWEAVLGGLGLPAFICGTVLYVGRRRRGLRAITALAQGGAFVVAFAVLFGWPGLPPHDQWMWVVYACMAVSVTGAVTCHRDGGVRINYAIRFAACVLCAALLTPPWAGPRLIWIAALALTMAVLWLALDGLARRVHETGVATSMFCCSATLVAVLVMSGNAKLGQVAGILAATSFAHAIMCVRRPAIMADVSGNAVYAVLLPGLAFLGHFNNFSSIPVAMFVMAGFAPCSALLGVLGRKRGVEGFAGALAAVAASAVTCGAIVVWAFWSVRGG